jgi:hypothetical protein
VTTGNDRRVAPVERREPRAGRDRRGKSARTRVASKGTDAPRQGVPPARSPQSIAARCLARRRAPVPGRGGQMRLEDLRQLAVVKRCIGMDVGLPDASCRHAQRAPTGLTVIAAFRGIGPSCASRTTEQARPSVQARRPCRVKRRRSVAARGSRPCARLARARRCAFVRAGGVSGPPRRAAGAPVFSGQGLDTDSTLPAGESRVRRPGLVRHVDTIPVIPGTGSIEAVAVAGSRVDPPQRHAHWRQGDGHHGPVVPVKEGLAQGQRRPVTL